MLCLQCFSYDSACIHHFVFLNCTMQWLRSDFLKYLEVWEASAKSNSGVELQEQNKMMLSRETLEGLRITGTYVHKLS